MTCIAQKTEPPNSIESAVNELLLRSRQTEDAISRTMPLESKEGLLWKEGRALKKVGVTQWHQRYFVLDEVATRPCPAPAPACPAPATLQRKTQDR